ncbi:hypothetical protein MMC28_000034 [Mycoblastus sanguinarius]|nr:hypothetical protein [Mycoblastus sanguinarius]
MPGKELGGSLEATPSPNLGSLKRHKTLPRRKLLEDGAKPTRSIGQERNVRRKSDQIAYSSAERIKSWIPDPSPIQPIPIVGVPLTPPINFRDDFQSWVDDAALKGRGFAQTQTHDISGTTPLVQQSPPTPETTPPRNIDPTATIIQLTSLRNPSESRTDSFKTARENQSSDDENYSLDSPSLRPSRQRWLRTTGISKHRDVGLGLGLESEEEPTPKEMTPTHSSKHHEFVTFDGSWGGDIGSDVVSARGHIGHRNQNSAWPLPLKERTQKRAQVETRPLDSPTLGQKPDTSLKKSLSLRQRVEQTRRSPPRVSTEKFAEQINWPLKDDHFDLDDANNKRLSQVSTTSTIVEAMVINSPPRRRQTLRHTGKMTTLNSSDISASCSNPNSLNSNDHSLRRRPRRGKSPDQELRKSFASDSPESIIPVAVKARSDATPVIVIPDRRSSLQSFTSSSKHQSRTFSLTSRQQSSRPTTAPEEAVGYFDIPRHDRRTVSVVLHAPTPLKRGGKVEKEPSPPELAQPSSPSLPTSLDPSRATSVSMDLSKTTSVTSGGNITHYIPPSPTGHQHATLHITDPQEASNVCVDRPSAGEWSALHPRSAIVTPFSLRSAHSSTPGTLEVHEATAISIYPHTNKSILVIQQTSGSLDSSRPKEQSAIIAGNANIELPGPVTPVIHHESPPREILNSPLKNPRDPPQPPDFKIIPPTPANAPSSSDETRRSPSASSRTNRLSTRFSSIKRSFSARRYSDSIVSPFTRTLSLRNSTTTARLRRRPRLGEDSDSKLHPFWRPRSFWDGLDESDSESEFGNTGVLSLSRRPSQNSRDVTPGRTMSLTRKLTGSMRLPHPARRQRRSSVASPLDQNDYEFIHPNVRVDEGNKAERMPRQGYQVQFVGFRGLADKLERRREAREEGKREERRKWLRERIGVVENGEMDDRAGVGGVGWWVGR